MDDTPVGRTELPRQTHRPRRVRLPRVGHLGTLFCLWATLFSSESLSQTPQPEPSHAVLNLTASPYAKIHPVPVAAVTITDGLWTERRKTNVEKSIPSLLEELESHGIIDNFRRLSGRKNVARRGPIFTDSDVYKWIEGAAFALQSEPNPRLKTLVDGVIDDIVAAQEPSGYLNTRFVEDRKAERWQNQYNNHELYCLGHLLQAAIAYRNATGDRKLLDAGIRFVNHILNDVIPSGQPLLAGHPEIEMALIELYRSERDPRFLDLAGKILTGPGDAMKLTPAQIRYAFSGIPFPQRTRMEGHAVRACYASAGATDYYLETGDPAYWNTLTRLWEDMVNRKMYITGGVGSRASGEAFGDPFELPNARAYTESCAAISNLMWSWRMLQASPEARYADVMERALYNSVNSGMSLSGTLYCYRNPLEHNGDPADRIRNPWYDTTCCPPNLERIFASLPGYLYGTAKDGLYVHLYAASKLDWRLQNGVKLALTQTTQYPWEGSVKLELQPARPEPFTLYLRIPGWSEHTSVKVNGSPVSLVKAGAYLRIQRTWKAGDTVEISFDMRVQALRSNPLARENQGSVALQRGPLVYVLEQTDLPAGISIFDVALRLSADPAKDFRPEWRADLLGGVTVLRHRGLAYAKPSAELPLYAPLTTYPKRDANPVDLTFVPYYTFHNRGEAAMQVWVPFEQR
jgi:DUF1680 family protein